MTLFSEFSKPTEKGPKATIENSFKETEKLSVEKGMNEHASELDSPIGKEITHDSDMRREFNLLFKEFTKPIGKEIAPDGGDAFSKGRTLTPEQRHDLQEKTGMQETTLDRCTVLDNGDFKLSCINEDKLGRPSDVPYLQKTVNIEGANIQVVMPEFKGEFEAFLPKELYRESDAVQFKNCVEQLSKAIQEKPDLINKFSADQLAQIKEGAPRIKGLIWHHDANPGRMVLVETKKHELNRHTGGKAIWGGGR